MKIHFTSSSTKGKSLWLVLSSIVMLLYCGISAADELESMTEGEGVSLIVWIKLIVCLIAVVAIVVGIRSMHREHKTVSKPMSNEEFLRFMQQQDADTQKRMEEFMRTGGASNRYHKSVRRVVRTTVNGQTTTTETTYQTGDDIPDLSEVAPEPTVAEPIRSAPSEPEVICKSCGGRNKLSWNNSGTCLYCGERIQNR